MMLDLSQHYFLPANGIELRAFTHGAMPRTVPEMMRHFVDDWRTLGVDAWNSVPNHWLPQSQEPVGWWSLPEYLGDRFIAPLIGASEGTCIMQPNLHWSMSCLLSDRGHLRGRQVVVTEDAFPSVLHSAQRWAGLSGYRLEIIPVETSADRKAVLDAVGADCGLVILTHVGFTTGARLSDDFLAEVAGRTHRYGGLFAVDGYHAAGTMPVDVRRLEIDVYAGGLLKEASGSSGNAFIYLRQGLDLDPQLTGWFGDDDPFAFDRRPTPHREVRRRFLGGTTAIAPLYHAVEGVRLLLDAGLEEVRNDSLRKTSYCLERAHAAGLAVRSPLHERHRGAMVVLEVQDAERLTVYLKSRGVFTDSRMGRYVRLAPFVWNTMDELDRAFTTIADALNTGAYLSSTPGSESMAGPVT